jgi:hypothetical protein
VDDIRLIVYPVPLGGGTRLFADSGVRRNFELISIEAFASGATPQRFVVFAGRHVDRHLATRQEQWQRAMPVD